METLQMQRYGGWGCAGRTLPCACGLGFAHFHGSDSRADAIRSAYKWAGGGVAEKLVQMSDRLGADAYDVANLINFESGGNPKARNKISHATGLIQFIPSTASRMGTSVDTIYQMSALDQLDLVEQYFSPYRGKLNTVQGVFMAVFYPKAMTWSLDTAFPSSVQKANPGIVKVGDYIRLATKRAKLPGSDSRIGRTVEAGYSANPVVSNAVAARVGGVAAQGSNFIARHRGLVLATAGMASLALILFFLKRRRSASTGSAPQVIVAA